MKLELSDNAATALKEKLSGTTFILALNDGSNQFSKVGGSCAIGDKFQIIATDQPKDDFNETLDNPTFKVFTSAAEKVFLGNNVKIDFNERLNTFVLKNESGILDNSILVKA